MYKYIWQAQQRRLYDNSKTLTGVVFFLLDSKKPAKQVQNECQVHSNWKQLQAKFLPTPLPPLPKEIWLNVFHCVLNILRLNEV